MWHSAKLLQQRLEVPDNGLVCFTAGGNNAVVVLQVGRIISHRQSEKIGKTAAGFF